MTIETQNLTTILKNILDNAGIDISTLDEATKEKMLTDLEWTRTQPLLIKNFLKNKGNFEKYIKTAFGPQASGKAKDLFQDKYLYDMLLFLYKQKIARIPENKNKTPEEIESLAKQEIAEDEKKLIAPGVELSLYPASRHKYMRDALQRAFNSGCNQFVTMGGGYSTHLLHKMLKDSGKYKDIIVYHVDSPEVIEQFKQFLAQQKIELPKNYKLIAIDYSSQKLTNVLVENGFDPKKSTHFEAEANLMYLKKAIVEDVFVQIGKFMQEKFTIAADIFTPGMLEDAKQSDDAAGKMSLTEFGVLSAKLQNPQTPTAEKITLYHQLERMPQMQLLVMHFKNLKLPLQSQTVKEMQEITEKHSTLFNFFKYTDMVTYTNESDLAQNVVSKYKKEEMPHYIQIGRN